MQDEEQAVAGLDREATLPEELASAFMQRASRFSARKGQILIAQGSQADDVYLIDRGVVQISTFASNGRETILRTMGSGRLVGEMAAISDMPRSACATIVEDSVLGLMSGAGFRTYLQEVPGAGYWMAVQLAARVRNLTEKTTELATQPVSARVQNELLRLAADGRMNGDRCEIAPLPTHADLAARTGTHREAVTRELRQLAQEGLVVQDGRKLVIVSVPQLRNMVERLTK